MEQKVPGQYDSKEAYRRFRAEIFRAHAIDLDGYGGNKKAAKLLGVSQQSVSNWKQRGLPIAIALKIDSLTEMDANYILQIGEIKKFKGGLEMGGDALSELAKQVAKLIQGDKPKRRG